MCLPITSGFCVVCGHWWSDHQKDGQCDACKFGDDL